MWLHRLPSAFETLWNRHPALLYGLSIWLGCLLMLEAPIASLVLLSGLLWTPLFISKESSSRWRGLLAIGIAAIAVIWAASNHRPPDTTGYGTGLVEWERVSPTFRHTKHLWQYRGRLVKWRPQDGVEQRVSIPVGYTCSKQQARMRLDRRYQFSGTLLERRGHFRLARGNWTEQSPIWSLGELRLRAKEALRHRLRTWHSDTQVFAFLSGLATGDFDDQLLVDQFGRFGLQHIMAISGFHFGMIALLLAALLRPFFSPQRVCVAMLALLSSYYLFIGPSPSVQRAWTTAIVVLAGQLLHRRPSSLNTLGFAMGWILFANPLAATQLGFQLSFLATGAILLLYPFIEEQLRWLWPKRALSSVAEMSRLDQHALLVLSFLRNTCALTIAVHLLVVPVLLLYFQKFPLLSLIYNLFYPFLVSGALALLLLALISGLSYPALAESIAHINEAYCRWILHLVTEMPLSIDFVLRVPAPPALLVSTFLAATFSIAVALRENKENRIATMLC